MHLAREAPAEAREGPGLVEGAVEPARRQHVLDQLVADARHALGGEALGPLQRDEAVRVAHGPGRDRLAHAPDADGEPVHEQPELVWPGAAHVEREVVPDPDRQARTVPGRDRVAELGRLTLGRVGVVAEAVEHAHHEIGALEQDLDPVALEARAGDVEQGGLPHLSQLEPALEGQGAQQVLLALRRPTHQLAGRVADDAAGLGDPAALEARGLLVEVQGVPVPGLGVRHPRRPQLSEAVLLARGEDALGLDLLTRTVVDGLAQPGHEGAASHGSHVRREARGGDHHAVEAHDRLGARGPPGGLPIEAHGLLDVHLPAQQLEQRPGR